MKTISTFTIIKNEAEFVGYHIMSILDYVDEMVFFDGNSADGTVEIIKHIKARYDKQDKIKLFENKDCIDLRDNYVALFNECLLKCTSEYVWFIHPDMICLNPSSIRNIGNELRYNVNVKSIAGEDRGLVIDSGRDGKWATIYKNDFGLHYYGHYGTTIEDLYFRDITGTNYKFYKHELYMPYKIGDTDIQLYHYCDTKPYGRRLGRMTKIFENENPNVDKSVYIDMVKVHPRVTLQDGKFGRHEFRFVPNTLAEPDVFNKYKKEMEPLCKSL